MWFIASITGKSGYLMVLLLVGLLIAVIFLPQIRQVWLKLCSEEVTISRPGDHARASGVSALNLQIITALGKDGIPSIDNPRFVTGGQADGQMLSNERVIGVSIDGDHRAYPLNMLSRHEIVNDTVGGVPIAVTW
jgi:hypothetical protein